MTNQNDSKPNEPACAGYDAPQAARLSDAERVSGTQCSGPGNAAHDACVNSGSGAVACYNNGNAAYRGCNADGNNATECGTGSNPD